MSEYAADFASSDQWLYPPEGVLEGSDFEIAQRYIDGKRDDIYFYATNKQMPLHLQVRYAVASNNTLQELDHKETQLNAGDADLATSLADKMRREVAELNSGQRITVVGQAYLHARRRNSGARVAPLPTAVVLLEPELS